MSALSALPLPRSARDPVYWRVPAHAGTALALARLIASAPAPILLIVPDAFSAARLQEELAAFGQPADLFPDWETLPYDRFSPHQDIISDRLSRLWHLPRRREGAVIVAAPTLAQRLPPPDYIVGRSLMLKVGDRLDIDRFRQQLESAGYRSVSQVFEHGEYAVRGSIVDLYPMGLEQPLRIDLFDDEIDSLRPFDPETQRSTDRIDRVELLPAREMPIDETGIATFRRNYRNRFEGDPARSLVYRQMSEGMLPAGIEAYLPLFFERTATLFDYLPDDTVAITLPGALPACDRFFEEAASRYQQRCHDPEHPILSPQEIYLPRDEVDQALSNRPRLLGIAPDDPELPQAIRLPSGPLPPLSVDSRRENPFEALAQFVSEFSGRILIAAESPGRREALVESLGPVGIGVEPVDNWPAFARDDGPRLAITVAPIEHGAVLDDGQLALVSETDLFAERVGQRRRGTTRTRDADALIHNLTELAEGAPVVHEDHGVGRYKGLVTLEMNGIEQEFLLLEYANDDRLYVPVSALHLISRYTGAGDEGAPLHRLGSNQWEKARRRAAEQVRDVAAELLDIHARRAARKGHAFGTADEDYRRFAEEFPFETTTDQQTAIDSVLADMRAPRPMDRVVCGDVGFGKTEVAMRAAFVAVRDGMQVAVLVPTTLLAEQHLRNFRDRFANWPVRVEGLSRLSRSGKVAETLADVEAGKVDIIIGTHKLLQGQARFKRLGLMIVDEEHRFGVRDKERLKALRAEVDLLTLTATPIPRTLNMALSGIRELSIIATPPRERLAIKTLVTEWDGALIREAVLRELKRGGQVYFLHNEVRTIERVARELEELVPEARTRIAHGQMPERALEQAMADFYHQRFNVLVATTIIESGIDVPTANTILINRADKLGLAQLHQIRGRVGRSHHRAYAYMIVPDRRALTADAVKRLEAIEQLEDLGVGFTLATHDLEIRGAGELLGENQSGQMHEVGFTLYMDLLERAVKALKSGNTPELEAPLHHGTEIDLGLPALIPADYVPDVHTRLILYKRISNTSTRAALDEMRVELIDRFGLLPEPVRTLMTVTQLRQRATPMGITKMEFAAGGGRLVFTAQPDIDPARIIRLVQENPATYRLTGETLRIHADLCDPQERVAIADKLLDELSGNAAGDGRR
ncbi:MAG: transcription-repair coupling factor [Halothiobacillaceae bacterium]